MKATTTKTLEPGSYSTGTCNPEHLIRRFVSILRDIHPALADGYQRDFDNADEDIQSEIINDLIDALDVYCPAGHYFGAHPGDGADFGVWACESDDLEPNQDDSPKGHENVTSFDDDSTVPDPRIS